MSKSNKIFDDMAQLAGGAAGLLNDLKQQMQNDVKARVEEMATKMDLVPREDLDALAMQVKTLQERIDTLEQDNK